MELPKELTTVTTTSKILAGIVFMTLPFIAFFIGTTYQALVTPKSTDTNIVSTPKVSTSSATSDWETYTSTKYGFSFMYPSGYSNDCCGIEGPASGSPENIIALADPTTAEGTSVPFNGFAVYVEPNNDGKTFESYVSEQKQAFLKKYKDDSGKEAQNLSEKSVNVGGEAGITLIGYIDWAKEIIFIPFPDEQKVLAIVMLEKSKGSFEAIFNQILSTFKFTDQSQTDSTADWKTYINTKNGYSLQYPNSLELVKGPGANLPDEEFQKLDNISFGGMQKSGDTNAGVVFGIEVNPQDANGKPIQCSTNDECLQKWMGVLNKTANQGSYINKIIMGKNIKGFEYQNKNSLYTQTNQYFVYPEGNKIWLVSLTTNNYTTAEVATTFDQILSTFKFT